jgi:RNA polymerase sigma factor (sigma-70 family)
LPWIRSRQGAAPNPEELAKLCQTDIYRYALRRTGHIEDAEDVAADTFAAALDALPGFKGDSEPRIWLLGIAARKLADRARKRCRRPERSLSTLFELPDALSGPEGAALTAEAIQTRKGCPKKAQPLPTALRFSANRSLWPTTEVSWCDREDGWARQ